MALRIKTRNVAAAVSALFLFISLITASPAKAIVYACPDDNNSTRPSTTKFKVDKVEQDPCDGSSEEPSNPVPAPKTSLYNISLDKNNPKSPAATVPGAKGQMLMVFNINTDTKTIIIKGINFGTDNDEKAVKLLQNLKVMVLQKSTFPEIYKASSLSEGFSLGKGYKVKGKATVILMADINSSAELAKFTTLVKSIDSVDGNNLASPVPSTLNGTTFNDNPYITFSFPGQGAVLNKLSNYKITWKLPKELEKKAAIFRPAVKIKLLRKDHTFYNGLNNYKGILNDGSYSWAVPGYFPTGDDFYLVLTVEGHDYNSPLFKIAGAKSGGSSGAGPSSGGTYAQ